MRYFNVNNIFRLIFLGVLCFQFPCYSMDELDSSKNVAALPKAPALDLTQMSHEKLLKFAQGLRSQQQALEKENLELKQITSGMSHQDQALSKILGMDLPEAARTLILVLEYNKKGTKPIFLEDALMEMQLQKIDLDGGPKTFGDVLRDEKISDDTARKVFRGLLTAINEEDALNFRSYSFSKVLAEKRLEICLVDFLCRGYHLVKVLYPLGSLTDYLIRKYSSERTGSFISESRTHRFAMF